MRKRSFLRALWPKLHLPKSHMNAGPWGGAKLEPLRSVWSKNWVRAGLFIFKHHCPTVTKPMHLPNSHLFRDKEIIREKWGLDNRFSDFLQSYGDQGMKQNFPEIQKWENWSYTKNPYPEIEKTSFRSIDKLEINLYIDTAFVSCQT